MKKITKRQIIKDYKNHFGIQDIPFKNLGKSDKEIIEWAEDLVKNLALSGVVKSFVCNNCQSKEEKKLTTSTSQCLKCGNLQAN